ncbi:phosphatidylglycerophosphatase and protein-tyrosine phosphatase 1-like [Physella acuta]|uniref:phosphatidylglycerophosphatase and protein-tyrosine phosphatase 1-like n=1 Tax=Physella acuta TaxID=109671 RepID=UPI0027DB839B|nr:phosphatidylglycerophosphatase and protein-tyrosine phosphatase 1-like [Physella acuta]XP_059148829.1 phosphatidylglycerophosphatase and protein-tyrosine phosphatase 1-like [Physella acuta]XP_059148830.1 phosphatidylglycerophosphatase and protein-tyrosine phosphatase 1-like [Physella acuta]XP_059148833.1 phosphatidylglycerophosphatase and protein-tyrosine phosphatase 1-like [Physella acuta]XP_059148834.1 phosphatidylglycerophosphatase and protein-tyrosine phosphatase 1-like [Physella acuta]
MFARLLFYPTLAVNCCMSKFTSRNWYDPIDETVILGALPLKSITLKLIKEEKIQAMISMNEDYEMRYLTYTTKELKALGVEHLKLRTVDLTGTPTQENLHLAVKFLLSHRQAGRRVYLHCKAGRTRSTTVAVCYLMQLHKWSPEKATNFVKSKRPQTWLRGKQHESIQCFYDSLKFS